MPIHVMVSLNVCIHYSVLLTSSGLQIGPFIFVLVMVYCRSFTCTVETYISTWDSKYTCMVILNVHNNIPSWSKPYFLKCLLSTYTDSKYFCLAITTSSCPQHLLSMRSSLSMW